MAELGLAPGPLLGQVVREVALAWESGEIADRSDALAVAQIEPGAPACRGDVGRGRGVGRRRASPPGVLSYYALPVGRGRPVSPWSTHLYSMTRPSVVVHRRTREA